MLKGFLCVGGDGVYGPGRNEESGFRSGGLFPSDRTHRLFGGILAMFVRRTEKYVGTRELTPRFAQRNHMTPEQKEGTKNGRCIFSIDVEDWFHILDVPSAPAFSEWTELPSRVA